MAPCPRAAHTSAKHLAGQYGAHEVHVQHHVYGLLRQVEKGQRRASRRLWVVDTGDGERRMGQTKTGPSIASAAAARACRSETLTSKNATRPGASRTRCQSSSAGGRRSTTATSAPQAASAQAISPPSAPAPPVTTAVRPVKSNGSVGPCNMATRRPAKSPYGQSPCTARPP